MNTRLTPVRVHRFAAIVLGCLLTAGCASAPDPSDAEAVAEFLEVNDPAEPTNRAVFEINRALDKAILRPVASLYRDVLPAFVKDGVHNALDNLRSPVVFFNDVLQGAPGRAMTTAFRFAVNSTAGLGGLVDVAAKFGIDGHNEDFGQTLAVWGIGEGPYVMLPLFGPSNPRDAVGLIVDFLVDPFNIWAGNTEREFVTFARSGTQAVDYRSGHLDLLDDLEKSSLDFYAAIRSLYRQRRADEISNGAGSANVPAPGLGEAPAFPSFDAGDEVSRAL